MAYDFKLGGSETTYDVNIHYDVEIDEEHSEIGKNGYYVWKIKDYEDSQELQVRKSKYLIFRWYQISIR